MKFKYTAIYQNKLIEGIVEAENKKDALIKLKEQNLTVLHLENVSKKIKKINTQFLEKFTRDFLLLIRSGISVDKALLLIAESEKRYGKELLKAYHELRKGSSIAHALSITGLFPDDYIELIKAGEESGNIADTLNLLYEFIHEMNEFKKNLIQSLAYPIFLLLVTLSSLLVLSSYVIPRFKLLFQASDTEIPLITKLVFALSDSINMIILAFLFIFIFAILILKILYSSNKYKQRVEKMFLKIPIIGNIFLMYDLIKVSNSLYTLLKGGVPLDKSIDIVKNVPTLNILRERFEKVLDYILKGGTISEALSKDKLIPDIVKEIIKVGEETGELTGAWFQIYISLSDNLKDTIKKILILIEPTVILITGLFIGFIIFGIIMGVFTISGSV